MNICFFPCTVVVDREGPKFTYDPHASLGKFSVLWFNDGTSHIAYSRNVHTDYVTMISLRELFATVN